MRLRRPQINKRNRLPLSALRCHRDRLSTTILAPFLAVEKKPPDASPAAWSRVRVIVSAVKRRRESTARFAEIHLEVAEIDLGIALALVRRLLEHFGPASRFAVEPILAEPLVLALAVDAAIGVRQGV
jgi:hypothetical protein